ncbi:LysR family transcriptional regulator [Pantoea sp. BAV 3049]|uniref:LysR family transcriptional regulator n=1 Tax=Pantoea sp. BAV 3049 TaxID=2654188 RepID=UPI00131E9A78|nr:LysR family transcriptional regulator [Pantoea sp. BAV 3049]
MKNAIRTMDLNLLKALDALLDERSVTRAADRLALTQPAVSGMLTRLRDCFGDPLFSRTQRGIVPTSRALELAAPVKQILSDMDALLQPKAFDPASAELTLTIAATDYALKAVVVPFIARLRQEAPGVKVSVVAIDYSQLQTQLERGDIDLALVTPETTPEGLHARNLFDEEYVCIMRSDHPQAREALTLDRFCKLDQVLVSHTGGRFSGATDEALAKIGKKRRVVMAVNSFLMLPEILRVSDLIAVTPYRLAATTDGMVVKTPPLPVAGFTKTLAWHDRTHRDAGHRWLRATLTELFA